MAEKAPKPDSFTADEVKEHISKLRKALGEYEKDHPHWRIEVLVSLIRRGLLGLKRQLEARDGNRATWDHPIVELLYPIEWDWTAPRDDSILTRKLTSGQLTKDNTVDAKTTAKTLTEIMVRQLNIMALQDFTNHVWLEKFEGQYNSILPAEVCAKLDSIKDKRARQDALDRLVRPFSIGAASIDYGTMEFRDGAKIPKHVEKQLKHIEELIDIPHIGFSGEINGRKVEVSLIFQLKPLVIDYDRRQAYHAITAGLFSPPRIADGHLVSSMPINWPQSDLDIF
jgi:hypothetical protein